MGSKTTNQEMAEILKLGRRGCTVCGSVKELGEFHKTRSGSPEASCKSCTRERNNNNYRKRSDQYKSRLRGNKRLLHQRWARTKGALKHRSKIPREFSITLEEYSNIVKDNACIYCGGPLPKTMGGLDRLDNNKGYTKENVVPCCFTCNSMRGNHLSHEEMKAVANFIKELRNGKN